MYCMIVNINNLLYTIIVLNFHNNKHNFINMSQKTTASSHTSNIHYTNTDNNS